MIRVLYLAILAMGPLSAAVPPSRAASTVAQSDTAAAPARDDTLSTPAPRDSLGAPAREDSLTTPARRDTIRAGEWTITGDAIEAGPVEAGTIDEAERRRIKRELQQIGSNEVAGFRQWQRKKNAKLAMLSSALCPGLGQLYNGRRIKVGLAAGFFWTYFAGAWLNWRRAQALTAEKEKYPEGTSTREIDAYIEFHKETSRDFVWWTGMIWAISILDAWIDAHLYDVRAYTPPAAAETSGTPQLAPQSAARATPYLVFTFEF